mgnify:CR=1 FL=1
MYAIIKTGGKQYTVAVGDKVKVETLPGDVGSQIKLVEVLAVKNDEGLKLRRFPALLLLPQSCLKDVMKKFVFSSSVVVNTP